MTRPSRPAASANYGRRRRHRGRRANPLISYWKHVVLERYTKFTGRARRAEFWWYFAGEPDHQRRAERHRRGRRAIFRVL